MKSLKNIAILALAALAFPAIAHDDAKPCPVPPPPQMGEMRPGGPDGKGEFMKRRPSRGGKFFDDFLSTLPAEEQAHLKALAKENPEAFRKAVIGRFEADRKAEMDHLMKLREAYLAAPAGEEKTKAKEAIRAKISADMDKHTQRAERRILSMEEQLRQFQERLEKSKARHEEMKRKKNEIIEKIVSDFTNPDKKPMMPPQGKKDGNPAN